MPPIAYTVIATLPDEPTASEYVQWLRDGHVQRVVKAGARDAAILRITDPVSPPQVESRYTFPDRQSFETYLTSTAPALRAEGLRKFPPSRGVRFERRIGELDWEHTPA
jgi:hypothetical protein